MKRYRAFIPLVLALLLGGCSGIDVSGLVAPEAPTSVPTVTSSAKYHAPPQDENMLGNLVLDVYPAQGETVRINDHTVAGMLLKAMTDSGQRIDSQADYPLGNTIVIRDADEQEIARVGVSSDGDMVGRDKESGELFRIPEWVYYQMEYYLWTKYSSLTAELLVWNHQEGDGPLMLRIDSMVRTMLPQAYGYADAYLTSYKVYGISEGSYQAKVYLLVAYAGYARDGDTFRLVFQRITPVALTLYELGGHGWRYLAYQEPKVDTSQTSSSQTITQATVRAIFPYEYTTQAMDDLKDPGDLPNDLSRKARDWLRDHGLGDLTISD